MADVNSSPNTGRYKEMAFCLADFQGLSYIGLKQSAYHTLAQMPDHLPSHISWWVKYSLAYMGGQLDGTAIPAECPYTLTRKDLVEELRFGIPSGSPTAKAIKICLCAIELFEDAGHYTTLLWPRYKGAFTAAWELWIAICEFQNEELGFYVYSCFTACRWLLPQLSVDEVISKFGIYGVEDPNILVAADYEEEKGNIEMATFLRELSNR